MSKKKELAKEIHILEEEIKVLEIKRSRSQAALIESLISRQTPDEEEMQFFRTFTADIEVKREQLLKYMKQLEQLV
ncbi:MAG: hypothetical protein OSJ83_01620 [Clostridia bacterium]|nr:hypothetical protein [Clostridia bacterium]